MLTVRCGFAALLLAAGCATATAPHELKSIADQVGRGSSSAIRRRGRGSGFPSSMPDPSYELATGDAAFARRMLERLKRIDAARLGVRFAIPQSDEWILANGSLPLQVLDQVVDEKLK